MYQLGYSQKMESFLVISNRGNSIQELVAWVMEEVRIQRGNCGKSKRPAMRGSHCNPQARGTEGEGGASKSQRLGSPSDSRTLEEPWKRSSSSWRCQPKPGKMGIEIP